MPFNLSEDEFDLPADLQALGDRLTQESQHLAQVYPAGELQSSLVQACAEPAVFPVFPERLNFPSPKQAVSKRAIALLVAATSLTILLALVLTWDLRTASEPEPAAVVQVAPLKIAPVDAPAEPSPALAARVSSLVPASAAAVAPPAWSSATPQPAVLLNASGPQLEGLFDLWERDQSPQMATVSF